MVSVVIASFNGAPFIEAQIKSILECLAETDELIVSDDGSTDQTLEIVSVLANADRRVRVVSGPSKGVNANFENALRCSVGDVIFLADQDDIWKSWKVSRVLLEFDDPRVMCVVHDVEVVDAKLNPLHSSYFQLRRSGPGLLKNWVRATYLGNSMAFRASVLAAALPIPLRATMHDQWIGAMSEIVGRSIFIPEVLGLYRRHEHNVTALNRRGRAASVVAKRFWTAGLILRALAKYRLLLRSAPSDSSRFKRGLGIQS